MMSNYFGQYILDICSQIFDVIQSDIVLQKQVHVNEYSIPILITLKFHKHYVSYTHFL